MYKHTHAQCVYAKVTTLQCHMANVRNKHKKGKKNTGLMYEKLYGFCDERALEGVMYTQCERGKR